MRIHIVSRCGLEHHLLIGEVHRRFDVRRIVRPVSPRRQPAAPQGALRRLLAACDRAFYGLQTRREQRALRAAIAAHPVPPFDDRIVDVPARELNGPAGLAALAEGAPDLLLLSGAPILREPALRIPRLGTINVHFGIAPQYRGQDTLFWPLYHCDYRNLGVTIHWVDPGIDSGPILARGWPRLSPDDDEISVGIACLGLSARLLGAVLARLARGERPGGEPQRERGRLCRGADRTLRRDLEHMARRHLLRRRPPALPERVELFLGPAARDEVGAPASPCA